MLEARVLPTRPENIPQRVELDLLADIELDEHQYRPLKCLVKGLEPGWRSSRGRRKGRR